MTDPAERIDERLLVLRCQAADEAAFAQLIARYQPRLRYFLRKLLGGDADRADDALQDVWFDVIRGLPKLADAGAFQAWVYRVARDRAFRQLRRPRLLTVEDSSDIPASADDADEPFGPEDAAQVHAALDALNTEHREVLLLRFIEDMSYEQIAQVAGCGVGTVRSRLHYAKRALREVIGRNGHE